MKTDLFPDLFNLCAETQAERDKRQAAQNARLATQAADRERRALDAAPCLDMDRPAQNLACFVTQDEMQDPPKRSSHQLRPGDLTAQQPMNTLTIDPHTALACLTFDAKPNPLTIRSLKEYGWTWNARARRWELTKPKNYTFEGARFMPADGTTPALLYALGAIGCPGYDSQTRLDALKKELDGAQRYRGDRAMEDAQGING